MNGITAAHKTLPLPTYVRVPTLKTAGRLRYASMIGGHSYTAGSSTFPAEVHNF